MTPSRGRSRFSTWVAVLLAPLAALTACPPTTVDPCLTQVNTDGFGDPHNRYAWAMAEFGPDLYVGTLNTISADEQPAATPGERDSGDGSGAVSVESDGTEIWRYDGDGWTRVVTGGFGDLHNDGTRALAAFDGALYAGTGNPVTGAEVWRSEDGVSWAQVNDDGFGTPANDSVRGLTVWRGELWAGTVSSAGAEVWAYDGVAWRRAAEDGIDDPRNDAVAVLYPYLDRLYAGTWNDDGARLYRFDGSSWEALVGGAATTPAGFGDPDNTGVFSIVSFHDALYASTRNFADGFSVWRSFDEGATWQAVATQGINDARQPYGWTMRVHDDQLFLGTWIQGLGPNRYQLGGQLYRTGDGSSWVEEVGTVGSLAPPGIGDDLNYGVRTLASFQGNLHIGTAQCFFCSFPVTGAEVWRRDGATCPR